MNTNFVNGENLIIPPSNKMGITLDSGRGQYPHAKPDPTLYDHYVMTDRGPKLVTVSLPSAGECCIHDWINFTVGCETFWSDTKTRGALWSEDYDEAQKILVAEQLPDFLFEIFGHELGEQCKSGRNFYKYSWTIGADLGSVSIGGQRGTILFMLSGKGLQLARPGWQQRLYDFLTNKNTNRPRLTRVDLAHDDFTGSRLTVDRADEWEQAGKFWGGRGLFPTVEHKGNWRRPTGAGRSLYIGQRQSGKYLRVYEKGKHEGAKDSLWTRAEVEFKSADRVLPFDMLLRPSDYFIAAYPAFADFGFYAQPEPIKVAKKAAKTSWKKALEITKRQYGKYIKQFAKVYEPDELIKLLSYNGDPAKQWPKRLQISDQIAKYDTVYQANCLAV